MQGPLPQKVEPPPALMRPTAIRSRKWQPPRAGGLGRGREE